MVGVDEFRLLDVHPGVAEELEVARVIVVKVGDDDLRICAGSMPLAARTSGTSCSFVRWGPKMNFGTLSILKLASTTTVSPSSPVTANMKTGTSATWPMANGLMMWPQFIRKLPVMRGRILYFMASVSSSPSPGSRPHCTPVGSTAIDFVVGNHYSCADVLTVMKDIVVVHAGDVGQEPREAGAR
jgi:hypothetical protein